jgi:hypothetical protein
MVSGPTLFIAEFAVLLLVRTALGERLTRVGLDGLGDRSYRGCGRECLVFPFAVLLVADEGAI